MCTHPARLFGCSSTRLFSTHELPPRVFHPGSPQSPPPTYGAMRYAVKICFDKFTWMSFLYFTCIKFWITLLTFTTTITLFSLAFPLMLIFMPVLCITCRFMGEVEEKIAIAVLLWIHSDSVTVGDYEQIVTGDKLDMYCENVNIIRLYYAVDCIVFIV